MYFLVTIPNESFHKVMSLRALQRRLGIETSVYRNSSELLRNVENSFGGRVLLLDWSNRRILASEPAPGASGLTIVDDRILASSWTDHTLHAVGGGTSISHNWFNHLHTVEPTPRGTLLVASAGIDALLELSLAGELLWYWPFSAPLDPALDYRAIRRSTSERAMHITSALALDQNTILAALFHQGTILRIDRHTGDSQVILDGLCRPHGIHRRPGGFVVSDTLGHRILLLDERLRLCSEIPFGFHWLQDTIPTSAGTWLVLENVHIDQVPELGLTNRIVELDPSGNPLFQLTIPPDFRLFTAREIGADFAESLRSTWQPPSGLEHWQWN
jgi:hypothetical protein